MKRPDMEAAIKLLIKYSSFLRRYGFYGDERYLSELFFKDTRNRDLIDTSEERSCPQCGSKLIEREEYYACPKCEYFVNKV